MRHSIHWIVLLLLLPCGIHAQRQLRLNEAPARAGEWGYRPAADSVSAVTPPGFCWRLQKSIASYELEVGKGRSFRSLAYRAEGIGWNVHCPPKTLPAGTYTWRYRGVGKRGKKTNWSRPRTFSIAPDATALPLPEKAELLARVPRTHPRLFLRPEDLPRLRELARGALKKQFGRLEKRCERLQKNPPPTREPRKYPATAVRLSEAWRKIWWGNRVYTIKALDGAATLAFVRLLGGKEAFGELARRILLECARWDPRGSTGYRYNDEAGMPYAYHFSRAYTFVHDLLTEEERKLCRRVMAVRGREMFRHLCPRHLWKPYASHSNRAWHFLGEVGIAFLGEIPEAEEWVWFAANVFACAYPVWSDDDGGWHEGSAYWHSYLGRFTWWADVMLAALDLDAFRKPFFSRAGYYPLYLMPPGKVGGGLGDLCARRRARDNVPLVTTFAAQAGNPHWQWYVEQLGGPRLERGFIGFLRGSRPAVKAEAPRALPASRLFRGTGQAVLNSNLLDANACVQVVFKSSPFGSYSHGYEAQNAFLLWAYGERLLIRTGRRDMYGSEHHRRWMWSTRSVNSITVNGRGQVPRSSRARGEILAFETRPRVDVVAGEAGGAYLRHERGKAHRILDRFTRTIVFVKPELILVFDRLVAREPSTFTYWLHAVNRIEVKDQANIRVRAGKVVCDALILTPENLVFTQTDQYDPNPRPRIKLREWHLSGRTPEKRKTVEFVALFRPHRVGEAVPREAQLKRMPGGRALRARLTGGEAVVLLPEREGVAIRAFGLESRGGLSVQVRDRTGEAVETLHLAR